MFLSSFESCLRLSTHPGYYIAGRLDNFLNYVSECSNALVGNAFIADYFQGSARKCTQDGNFCNPYSMKCVTLYMKFLFGDSFIRKNALNGVFLSEVFITPEYLSNISLDQKQVLNFTFIRIGVIQASSQFAQKRVAFVFINFLLV